MPPKLKMSQKRGKVNKIVLISPHPRNNVDYFALGKIWRFDAPPPLGKKLSKILHVNIFETVAPYLTLAKKVFKSYLSVTLGLIPSALTHTLLLDLSTFKNLASLSP